MTNGARLIWYLIGLVAFVAAVIVELAQAKKITPVALIAAGLAAVTVVPFWDAVKAS